MSDPEGQLVKLVEERRLWEALTDLPVWATLVATLQAQADDLQATIIYQPLRSADDVFAQEFKKGQLEGRLSITNTVETILSELEYEVRKLKEIIEDGTGTASSAGIESGDAFRSAP